MQEYKGKENLKIMSLAKNYNHTIFNWIISDVDLKKNNILDFGSGNGEFCNRFKDGIYAVELDTTMHNYLNCPSEDNIEKFNKKFDLIYSSNVLEHIKNDTDAIQDLYDYLVIGGVAKVLVPAQMELYSNMDKIVGHHRRYSKEELINKFSKVGFRIEYCRYFDFIGYFASFFYKLFINKGVIDERSLILYDKLIFPLSNIIDKITFGKIIGKNIMLKAIKK
jgi:SAM-dependent methyltransferase